MKTLDFKPVKRCGGCNHLIPSTMAECPYCKGKSFINKVQAEVEEPANLEMPTIQFTPKQKKMALLAVVLAALAFGIVALTQYILDSRALSKSIFDPLSEKVVAEQTKKDKNFADFYKSVEAIRETIKTPEDQQKYKDISYKQLQEFLTYYSDKFYCDKLEKDARQRHTVEKIAPIQPKIDEITTKWEKFIEEHDVYKYIDVKVVSDGYQTVEGYWYDETRPAFYFTCQELQGKLKDCSVSFLCFDEEEYSSSYYDFGPINLETIKEHLKGNPWTINTTNTNFWKEHHFGPQVHSVTLQNGTVISQDDIEKVPMSVRDYLHCIDEETETALIRDQIDPKYPTPTQFAYEAIQKNLQEKDPLCYELVDRFNSSSSWQSIPKGFKTP